VSQVQLRLLQYWSLQAIIEAAAERFPIVQQRDGALGTTAGACKVYEASLPACAGAKASVAVPAGWPRLCGDGNGAGAGLRLVGVSGPGVDAAALTEAVNGDTALCASDLLTFLEGVASKLGPTAAP
jgi:hypothetical protein